MVQVTWCSPGDEWSMYAPIGLPCQQLDRLKILVLFQKTNTESKSTDACLKAFVQSGQNCYKNETMDIKYNTNKYIYIILMYL